LARSRHTPPQARIATASERRRNVEGAFVCRHRGLASRSILLVDDVTTTGATLEACAAALKAAGAARVRALTFARED
ncbi:MAG: phosphoribosyltransferase family protein, partial [Dehalococcoidia bacterium]